MSIAKYVIFAALGVAAVALLTSDSTQEWRDDVADNAKKWKGKLKKFGGKAASSIDDLQDMLVNEVEGLSDDARTRIATILESANKGAGNLKKSAKQLI
jgi:gas vesicle protein